MKDGVDTGAKKGGKNDRSGIIQSVTIRILHVDGGTAMDAALIKALKEIAAELKHIRRILAAEKAPTQITFSKDGVITETKLDDLESYFERMEDDIK